MADLNSTKSEEGGGEAMNVPRAAGDTSAPSAPSADGPTQPLGKLPNYRRKVPASPYGPMPHLRGKREKKKVRARTIEDAVIDSYVLDSADKFAGRPAIGYVRVSTHEQADRGLSLISQRKKITAYCTALGFDLLTIYEDAGISGEKIETRPGMQQAVSQCIEKRATLICYSLSRLSRKLADILAVSQSLIDAQADLNCIVESFDTSTAAGRMCFKMFGVLAEFERELISERTKAGLSVKRNEFVKISRHSPYGWKTGTKHGEDHVPDDAEQKIRNFIISKVVNGTHPSDICKILNKKGYRYRGGKRWYSHMVSRVIRHAVNLGEVTFKNIKKMKECDKWL